MTEIPRKSTGCQRATFCEGVIFEKISAMVRSSDYEQKRIVIDEICAAVIRELQAEGLSDSTSKFLLDHGPIMHEKIVDRTLRNLDVWIG